MCSVTTFLSMRTGTTFVVVDSLLRCSYIAAIARHLYMRPCVGINSLREHFGGKHRNGVRHAYHDHVCSFTGSKK